MPDVVGLKVKIRLAEERGAILCNLSNWLENIVRSGSKNLMQV